MSNFTNSLFRIDPTEGLLQYVQSIKPYHSKVLDVFVEYVYGETIAVNMLDSNRVEIGLEAYCTTLKPVVVSVVENSIVLEGNTLPQLAVGDTLSFKHSHYIDTTQTFTIASVELVSSTRIKVILVEPLSNEPSKHPADRLNDSQVEALITHGLVAVGCYPRKPTVYSCGYGLTWDSPSNIDVPSSVIIQAEGIDDRIVTITSGSTDVLCSASDNIHTLQVGDVMTLMTTSTLPTTSTIPIHIGHPLYVVYAVGNTIRLSDTSSGSPLVFTSSGTGTVTIRRMSPTLNSFIVSSTPPTVFPVAVLSTTSNQLFIVNNAAINAVSLLDNSVWVAGDVTSSISVGDVITVSSNPILAVNRPYTVGSIAFIGGSTQLVLQESLPATTIVGGFVNYRRPDVQLPGWRTGMAVTIAASPSYTPHNLYPTPINPTTTYYVNLTSTPGVFNLTTKRFSTNPADVVDITDVGTGVLSIQRTEPYVVGDTIAVTGSLDRGVIPNISTNDGTYTISRITTLGANIYRIHVIQSVKHNTPSTEPTDGTIVQQGTYGSPQCVVVSAHPLHTDTVFSERLVFDFGDDTDTVPNDDTLPYDVVPLA